jgi:hydroxymethylpyrimidine pyrophosphatase-like HAD family hydrolase
MLRLGSLLIIIVMSNKSTCHALSSQVKPPLRAIMSDIDGTLVHYAKDFTQHGVKLISSDQDTLKAVIEGPNGEIRHCRLLPSATMGPACISDRTVELVHELRNRGVLFCVITAARKSTMRKRLDMLPACDAVACEGGSRLILNNELDGEYASEFEHVCGPMDRQEVGEDDRPETLWQFYRRLRDDIPGLKMDANNYYGMFRVSALGDETTETALQEALSDMPSGLSFNSNLGKTDIYPTNAGKANTVKYLQKKFGIHRLETACLFDDDNDLLMARECGIHALPSLTSFSIKSAVARNPRWYIPQTVGQGVFATEECLEKLLESVALEGQRKSDIDALLGEVGSVLPASRHDARIDSL